MIEVVSQRGIFLVLDDVIMWHACHNGILQRRGILSLPLCRWSSNARLLWIELLLLRMRSHHSWLRLDTTGIHARLSPLRKVYGRPIGAIIKHELLACQRALALDELSLLEYLANGHWDRYAVYGNATARFVWAVMHNPQAAVEAWAGGVRVLVNDVVACAHVRGELLVSSVGVAGPVYTYFQSLELVSILESIGSMR